MDIRFFQAIFSDLDNKINSNFLALETLIFQTLVIKYDHTLVILALPIYKTLKKYYLLVQSTTIQFY